MSGSDSIEISTQVIYGSVDIFLGSFSKLPPFLNWGMDMNLGRLQEIVRDREALNAAVHGIAKSRAWLETEHHLCIEVK